MQKSEKSIPTRRRACATIVWLRIQNAWFGERERREGRKGGREGRKKGGRKEERKEGREEDEGKKENDGERE